MGHCCNGEPNAKLHGKQGLHREHKGKQLSCKGVTRGLVKGCIPLFLTSDQQATVTLMPYPPNKEYSWHPKWCKIVFHGSGISSCADVRQSPPLNIQGEVDPHYTYWCWGESLNPKP